MSAWMREKPLIRVFKAAFKGLTLSAPLNTAGYLIGLAVAHSAGMIKIVEALFFAYLIAGLYHVLSNLRLPLIKQPGFARSRTPSSLAIGLLFWLPASFINLRWGRGEVFTGAVLNWVIFVVGSFLLASI